MADGGPVDLEAAVRQLRSDVLEALGRTSLGTDADGGGPTSLRALHDALAAAVLGSEGRRDPRRLELLERAEILEDRSRRSTRARVEEVRAALDDGIARIRSCRSTAELFERLGDVSLAACRARRVAISRDGRGVEIPEIRAVAEGVSADEDDWEVPRRVLDDVLRARRARIARSPSCDGTGEAWVYAPITIDGATVALLRALPRDGVADDETLWSVERFALTVGLAYEALETRDRIAEVGATMDGLRSTLDDHGIDESRALMVLPGAEWPGGQTFGIQVDDDTGLPTPGETEDLDLTPRQRQTLDLLLQGLSNEQIADRLVVSVPTVKSHVGAILRAVGAVNRAEVIARFVGSRAPG